MQRKIPGMTKSRYQRGSIRVKSGTVYGEWRGEPKDGKRPHLSVQLGQADDLNARGRKLTKNEWRDLLRPHIERYYETLRAPAEVNVGMTVADFIAQVYLPAHEPGWAKTSKAALCSNLRVQVLNPLGKLALSAVQKNTIVQRLNEMRAQGKTKSTIKTTKWLLHSIFEEAIDNDLMDKTPVRRIRLTNIPDCEETRPLTEDEVRRLFASTEGLARLAWRTMIGCGLRPGEVAALRRNDVGETLRVDEALELGEFGPTKTRKVRFVPIPATLRAELEARLREIAPGAKALVFTLPSGEPMTRDFMYQHIQQAARAAAGIPDLKLRMARTTFATLLSGDIKDLQGLMGHANPEMTLKHYKKAINSRQAAAVEELDERLTRPALKVISGGRK